VSPAEGALFSSRAKGEELEHHSGSICARAWSDMFWAIASFFLFSVSVSFVVIVTLISQSLYNHSKLPLKMNCVLNMTWDPGGSDCVYVCVCVCVSPGPGHAPMQQHAAQVQSATPSASLSLQAGGYGSPASGYGHSAPSSQSTGPGYGSSSSSSYTPSSSSSRSNLNMQSNQSEPGIKELIITKIFGLFKTFYVKDLFQAYDLNTAKNTWDLFFINDARRHICFSVFFVF